MAAVQTACGVDVSLFASLSTSFTGTASNLSLFLSVHVIAQYIYKPHTLLHHPKIYSNISVVFPNQQDVYTISFTYIS